MSKCIYVKDFLNKINNKKSSISNTVYGGRHSKLFTNFHVSWDTLYKHEKQILGIVQCTIYLLCTMYLQSTKFLILMSWTFFYLLRIIRYYMLIVKPLYLFKNYFIPIFIVLYWFILWLWFISLIIIKINIIYLEINRTVVFLWTSVQIKTKTIKNTSGFL